MLQITIKRNGTITNGPLQFESQELLDSWYATHVENFGEHECIIEDVTDALAQEKANAEAKAFLAKTDYLVIRFMESGIPYPEEIKLARQAARDIIK